MSISRFVCAALGAAFLVATVATVGAQPLDKRTYFTFSGPVTIPGATLPAGKYVFRFVDVHNQNVMQVLSGDGQRSYALFLTLRAQRSDTPNDPEVRFMETAQGTPPAIHTWWYPGQRTGWEFVYPKRQARMLARGARQPVLTTVTEAPVTVESAPVESELALVSPTGEETKVAAETRPAVAPAGPSQVGELAPPALAMAAPTQQARAALPKTASDLPLLPIIGLALVLVAAALWGRRIVRAPEGA
jgi:LPXTG-motif cell wall-anchored protein